MVKKAKKKDAEKAVAQAARKAAKQDKVAKKHATKALGDEPDIEALLLEASKRDVARTEVTVTPCAKAEITPRCNASLTAVGSELYLFGGERYDGAINTVYKDLYRWRVDKDEWAKIESPSAPSPRCSHQAVALASGGRDLLYVFGGEFATLAQYYHYRDLWRFDPKTNLWEQLAREGRGPSARSGHRIVAWRGQLLLFGGFFKPADREPRWFNDVWIYAPANDTWTEISFSTAVGVVKPPPRSGCVLQVCGDSAIVWGGYSEAKCENMIKAKGREHTDAWLLQLGSLVAGGKAAPSPKALAVWERCNAKGRAPTPRVGASSCARGDRVYVFGGVHDVDGEGLQTTSVFFDDLYQFDFATKRWSAVRPRADADDEPKRRRRRAKDADAPPGDEEEEEDDDDDDDDATAASLAQAAWDEARVAAALLAAPAEGPLLPPPRIGGMLTFRDKAFHLLGGVLETGDREVVLDDSWSFDPRKKKWVCLERGTMHTQTWTEATPEEEGLEGDDDDEGDDDEEEDDDDDDDETRGGDDDDDEDETKAGDEEDESKDETKDESRRAPAAPAGPLPRSGEALRAFFERTREHWLAAALADDASLADDAKGLKRAGFEGASAHYEVHAADADAPPPPPRQSKATADAGKDDRRRNRRGG
ncbi:hypothetical protein M885DRAFT_565240 [Pelagophyceae sp. CCMP2097]|nr:hypothetical protein M885DRAFT_565240 [Pelagophyceae sp. CCMP2097]